MRMPIPFAGRYNDREQKSIPSQNAINWYPEINESTLIMQQRHGLKLDQVFGTGPHRASFEANGYLFIVSNNTVYKKDTSGYAVTIGTLNTYAGNVSISDNSIDLIIVDGTDGFAYEYGTGTFTQITDVDFTALGSEKVRFLDGHFIVDKPGTGEFYISTSYPSHAQLTTGGTGWTSLLFANAEADPDNLVTHEVIHQQIALLGKNTTEFWVNVGNPLFAFERQPGGVVEMGCLAPWSVCKADESLVWLARNRAGHGFVVQASGFSPTLISTDAVDERIARMVDATDAVGHIYKEGRHLMYSLTFISGNCTLVYDFSTKTWHERQSYNVGRFRIRTHAYFNGKHYMGDEFNGNLYTLDRNTFSDNGDSIKRTVRTDHQSSNQDRIFCHELQVLFEQGAGLTTGQGSDPQAMLRYSDDRGHTWSNEDWKSIGKIGEYDYRTRWLRKGSYRNRTWELSVSDPIRATIVGAFGRFSKEK